MDDHWQKIYELAIQNTIAHNSRVELLSERFVKIALEKNLDPVEALEVLKKFKTEMDQNIEKLSNFAPKISTVENKLVVKETPKKPLASRLAETSKEKLIELKEILDKIIKS